MNFPGSNSHHNLQHLSPLPTLSQQVQCETSISKENQNYSSTGSLSEPNLQPGKLSSYEDATSFISDKRNDSGYEDVCSFNQTRTDLHRMQEFHNDSGICSKDLVTKLSFTGLSSTSSICSDAYYYAGSESTAISLEDAKRFRNMNGTLYNSCIKSANTSPFHLGSPVGYGCQLYNDFSNQQPYTGYLSLLAPLHRYAAPGKETLYYNTQSVGLNKMVVSP